MIEALQFLTAPPDESLLYIGVYDPVWVVISVLLAIFASHAALNASARVECLHDTNSKLIWTSIAAFTLGIGVWAMHFIGMMALSLPCGVRYDPLITLISMIPGILASGVALGVVWNHGTKHLSPLLGSILLGASIGTMHYTGMAAMRLEGLVRYDPSWFALSILVAVALAYLALRVKNGVVSLKKHGDVLVAVIMGGAVSGMHYTAMSATYFVRGDAGALPHSLFTTNTLAILVVTTTVFLALGALALASISRNREMAEELRIAATAFESHESLMITDADGVIQRVNQAFTESTGYTAEEAVGKKTSLLKSGRHDTDFYKAMWDSIKHTGVWQGEIWDRRKNGEIYPKWLSISAVKNTDGVVSHYVGSHIDITERKVAEEKIQHLAYYDPLTRLPNRLLLMDRLGQALASSTRTGKQAALLFIDMDNFKTLNDTLGHDIGDMLLKQVAQRLTLCVREGDTVSRLGGDEFMVVLENLNEQALEAAAQTEAISEKVLATLSQLYQLGKHEYHSTPSIGVTLFNDHQASIEELMKQADIAMYQAKQAGRNTMRFFDPQMQAAVDAHAALESDLAKALEQQQFQLYYQIQMDELGRPFGAETLIRWIHPERGFVSPAQFIPLAEESGLILLIGQWVLDTACAQLKAWEQDALTLNLVLAVNVSAKQFRQVNFVAQVQATVQRHAINPKRLKLELTEGMLVYDVEKIIATMNTLKEAGIEFSMDDFGTGYSSLQYLKRLPLAQLKIDQSFVRDMVVDSDNSIVQTIIAMARSMNLNVIAEGVETEEQRQLLSFYGCHHYQGYLFSKPVPVAQFEALLKQELIALNSKWLLTGKSGISLGEF
jgi:diguanylate cyclase (GGDEF)-like protein/PAS domain S-box-containing protein